MSNIDIYYIKKHYPIIHIAKRLGLKIDKNNKSICPFHQDTNPSLSFNIKENYYHCFSCGAGGDNIKLVKEILNCDFKEAVRFITGNEYKPLYNKLYSYKTNQYNNYSDIYNSFINLLDNQDAFIYLKGRFITENQIINHKIKNLPIKKEEQLNIINELLKHYSETDLIKSGIVSKSIKYQSLYLFHFRHRLIIPYFDIDGITITSIQGRIIDNISNTPKYLFNKNSKDSIYNIDKLQNNITSIKDIVLCEGVIDCLSLERLGFTSISLSGATKYNLLNKYDILNNYNIYSFSDNDKAGEKLIKDLYNLDNYRGKFKMESFSDKNIKDINELLTKSCIKNFKIGNKKYEYFEMPNDKICILDYYIFTKEELREIKKKKDFEAELKYRILLKKGLYIKK